MWSFDEMRRIPQGGFPPHWASSWGDDVYGLWADLTINHETQRMRWVEPSGEEGFWMGSSKKERLEIKEKNYRELADKYEMYPTKSYVPHGFWLADTPCTQAFWRAVSGNNPSHFRRGRDAPDRPVENVRSEVVISDFINKLEKIQEWGLKNLLFVPDELQWEYAARAGATTAYWWGDNWREDLGNADITMGRNLNDKVGTTPVKKYSPNPWGFFDVHGNVWEICSNYWIAGRGEKYLILERDNRVVRGGSWILGCANARAACRRNERRGAALISQGFRFGIKSVF
jgi:formylglycine-generating enzyme